MSNLMRQQQERVLRARKHQEAVPVTGVWLRTTDNGKLEVLVETAGEWRVVIDGYRIGEREQEISHIVEPAGILKGEVWR
jgi:hypothetical protein